MRCEMKFFQLRIHLAEGLAIAIGHEDRIIAETAGSAWRPDERAGTLCPLRHWSRLLGAASARAQVKLAVRSVAPARLELAMDALHGKSEVLLRRRPSARRGCRARRQAPDTSSPESSASGRQPRGPCRRLCLERRVLGEALRRSPRAPADQARPPTPCRCRPSANSSASSCALPSLWLAMTMLIAGFELADHRQATVSFCNCTSSAMPRLASAMSWSNCAWLKASCSAVPCTSTMPPDPVMTKFASACASKSSA